MGCDFPIPAYRSEERTPTGKRKLTFNPRQAVYSLSKYELPCGKCMGCRLERSRQWAVRMMHEAKMHELNSFLTLTYRPEDVPQSYSLQPGHLRDFMKRLREHHARHNDGAQIRFYAAGEYGDQFGRPHYHAAIFGLDFRDKRLLKRNDKDQPIYTSETLDRLWKHGQCSTANLDFESAAYIARYCVKKINGDKAADHYYRQSPMDGRWYNVEPEFARMSRRPGLGAGWLDQHKSDVFPSGFIVERGVPQAPPRFYINRLTEEEQSALKKQARRRALQKDRAEKTDARRYVRAQVRDARIQRLKRDSLGD